MQTDSCASGLETGLCCPCNNIGRPFEKFERVY